MNREQCERVDHCVFFNGTLSEMPSISKRLQHEFCDSDKYGCARYKVHQALIQGFAPPDEVTMVKVSREMQSLFPDDAGKADRIIGWLTKL